MKLPHNAMTRQHLTTPTRVVLLTAVYFLGGLLGKVSAFMGGDVALVWPPAGIALAAILLFGYRFLPGVAIGAILFSLLNGQPLGFFTFGTAVGNCVGAMVCAYLLQHTAGFRNSFDRVRDAAVFVVLASLFGTTINAFFNVASLHLPLPPAEFLGKIVEWWVPNAMGCLVVTPFLLSWSEFRWQPVSRRKLIELALCWAGLFAAVAVSFNSWYVHGIDRYPLAYLPYPFLVWAALRFGVRGATLGTLIVSGASIYALLRDRGPFVVGDERENLLLIGSYIAVLAISNLLLGAAAAERRNAVRAVMESERRYRAVVEDQTELICRFDRRGLLTFVNDAFCRTRKSTRDELLGTTFLPQVTAEDMEIPLQRFHALTPADPLLSYDARVTLPSGERGWEQCTTRAIFDETGALSEFQMVSRDITGRKQTEEALRESEERIKAILTDAIVTVGEDWRIKSANPAAERIFGYAQDELLSISLTQLLDPEDLSSYQAYVEAVRSNAIFAIEIRGRRRGGTVFPMNVSLGTLAVNGRAGFIMVARDVTERKQVEEQLRHVQRLDTVGHLAGGVAHDFNNILSIIVGHCSLLIDRHKLTGRPRHSLEQILTAAERGSKLTRQLLMFSRRQIMQTKRLELNAVVADLARMLQRVLGEHIDLHLDYSSHGLFVQADEGMLDQILMNLAVNSRDAMPRGGKLRIATSCQYIRENELFTDGEFIPGEYSVLSVADTGCGIPGDVLPHIFEPFFTTKDIGKGTGLGLSIVYGIVKQHKGVIKVRSEVGKGTTFDVYLPLVPLTERPREEAAVVAAAAV